MREIKRSEAKERARRLSKAVTKTYVAMAKELKYNGVVLGENTASADARSKFDAIAEQAAKDTKKKKK
jgi:hypothetical protein